MSNLSSVTRAADLKTRFSQYGKVRSEFIMNSKSFTVFSLNLSMTGKINFQTFGAILSLINFQEFQAVFAVLGASGNKYHWLLPEKESTGFISC